MRLFIAIDFCEATRSQLMSLTGELHRGALSGTFVDPANLHLTLAFLGECSTFEADRAAAALDTLTFPPFDLTIDTLGCFSNHRKRSGSSNSPFSRGWRVAPGVVSNGKENHVSRGSGNTWWAGIAPNPDLEALHAQLTGALDAAQLSYERQAFKPHITLGRKVRLRDGRLPGDLAALPIDIEEQVDAIHLYRSELGRGPGGSPRYHLLYTRTRRSVL
ncbi:MAG: RNA 2',3'-cyclic phosphodiesterase [Coriobacteriales bacterium]|jgi:2'-5' RNA ligase|nr:RNA 2',3'-cyclic phosphodiesterase [Coriobacteriales bacterium]